jgi:hypothetical protein
MSSRILDADQKRQLRHVRKAAEQLKAAQQRLRAAALDAVDLGVPVLRVAETAGVSSKGSRTTIYRWLEASASERKSR